MSALKTGLMLALVVVVAVLVLWAVGSLQHSGGGYAPSNAQEPDSAPASEPGSQPVTGETQLRADEGLPASPIPYDQLATRGSGGGDDVPPAGAKPPPKPKSDEKAIFY
jgi:hypothetical protein